MNAMKITVAGIAIVAVLLAAPATCAEAGDAAALREQLNWHPAPPVPAFVTRASLAARPTLEELITAGQPAASQQARPTSPTVIPGESYPAKHRALIRRYFELIRHDYRPGKGTGHPAGDLPRDRG